MKAVIEVISDTQWPLFHFGVPVFGIEALRNHTPVEDLLSDARFPETGEQVRYILD